MRLPSLLALLLLLPLSGCLSGGHDEAAVGPPIPTGSLEGPGTVGPAVPPAPIVTLHVEGRTATEAVEYAAPEVHHDLEFEVLPGATAILVELAWDDGVQDLDVILGGPKTCNDQVGFPVGYEACIVDSFTADGKYGLWWNKDGHAGAPDSPARILIGTADLERVGTGDWLAYAWTKDVNQDLPFHLYATVFYGVDPAGFSALPA